MHAGMHACMHTLKQNTHRTQNSDKHMLICYIQYVYIDMCIHMEVCMHTCICTCICGGMNAYITVTVAHVTNHLQCLGLRPEAGTLRSTPLVSKHSSDRRPKPEQKYVKLLPFGLSFRGFGLSLYVLMDPDVHQDRQRT